MHHQGKSSTLKMILVFFIFLYLASPVMALKCPTDKSQIESTFTQVDNNTLKVGWYNETSDLDWADCVTSVNVLVNNEVKATVNGSVYFANVNLVPCKFHTVGIHVNLKGDPDQPAAKIELYKKKIKIYLGPQLSTDAKKYVTLVQKSRHEAELNLTFDKFVENLTCNKISRIEITVDEVLNEKRLRIYTNVTETARYIVWKLPLNNECASHVVNMRLHGFGGTQPAVLEKILQPFASRTPGMVPTKGEVVATFIDKISLKWTKVEEGCISGYVILIKETESLKENYQHVYVDANHDHKIINDLKPCTKYSLELGPFSGSRDNPKFSKDQFSRVLATTRPDTGSKFAIQSLKYKSGGTSARLSWRQSEHPCLLGSGLTEPNIKVDICSSLEPQSCMKPPRKIYNFSDNFHVTFRGLRPCRAYYVRFQPILSPPKDSLSGSDITMSDFEEHSSETIWEPLWKTIRTMVTYESPVNLRVKSVSIDTITLSWRFDSCATDYMIFHSPSSNFSLNGGSRWLYRDSYKGDEENSMGDTSGQKMLSEQNESNYEFESNEVEPTTSFPATSSTLANIEGWTSSDFSKRRKRRNTEYDDTEYPETGDDEQKNEGGLTTEEDKSGEIDDGESSLEIPDYNTGSLGHKNFSYNDGDQDDAEESSISNNDDSSLENEEIGSGDGWVGHISDDEEKSQLEGSEVDHVPHKSVVGEVTGLSECQEYIFKVVAYFKNKGVEKFSGPSIIKAKTKCSHEEKVKEVTTADPDTTTVLIEPENHISNVTIEQSEPGTTKLSWKTEKFISLTIRITDRAGFDVEKQVSTSEEAGPKVFFISLPHCRKFRVTFTTSFNHNTTQKISWTQDFITGPSNEPFELLLFGIRNDTVHGEFPVTWSHKYSCIKSYKLILTDMNNTIASSIIPAPDHVLDDVFFNMANFFKLENCRMYQIIVRPDEESSQNPGLEIWSRGFNESFIYVTDKGLGPNEVTKNHTLEVSVTNTSAILTFPNEPFYCGLVNLKVTKASHLNQTDLIVPETIQFHEDIKLLKGSILKLDDLEPCMTYTVKIHIEELEHGDLNQHFQTLPGSYLRSLSIAEVSLLPNKLSKFITLEFVDVCANEGYQIKICRDSSYSDCKHHGLLEEQVSSNILTTLKASIELKFCTLFFFYIEAKQEKQILYQGSFHTSIQSDSLVQLEKSRISIQQNGSHLWFSWKYNDGLACIQSYRVEILKEGELQFDFKVDLEAKDFEPMSAGFILPFGDQPELEMCKKIQARIFPLVTQEETDQKVVSMPTTFDVVFNKEPKGRENLTVIEFEEDSFRFLWSDDSFCYGGFQAKLFDSDDGRIVFQGLYNEGINDVTIRDLIPCSPYNLEVSSLLPNLETELRQLKTEVAFYTKPSFDQVQINCDPVYESIEFELLSGAIECVDSYELELCEKEGGKRCIKGQLDYKDTGFKFEELMDNTFYQYEVFGYNKEEGQVFHLYKREVQTLARIQGHFFLIEKTSETLSIQAKLQINLEGYKKNFDAPFLIKVFCSGDFSEFQRSSSEERNNFYFEFDKLSPDTTYTCKGKVSKGDLFAEIPQMQFKTLDGIPDEPENVTVVEIKQTEVKIYWSPPLKTRGTIKKYTIKVRPQSSREVDQQCEESSPSLQPFDLNVHFNNVSESWINGLMPNTKYSVQMIAHTSHEEPGKPSREIHFATHPGPPREIEILRVAQNKGGNVIVHFWHSCPLYGPTEFKPKWRCASGLQGNCLTVSGSVVYEVHKQAIQIKGLTGGKTYDFSVEAFALNCEDSFECSKVSSTKTFPVICEHTCRDGTCIQNSNARCNFIFECPDKSDEYDCKCEAPTHFKCTSGHCIQSSRRCDRSVDCNDGSDEKDCPSCDENQFRCKSTNQCIPKEKVCDKKNDCNDKSDEYICSNRSQSCWPDLFNCGNNQCISKAHLCDGIWDCMNGYDELICSNYCPTGKYGCRDNKTCILGSQLCDGTPNCPNGDDESYECKCHKKGQMSCKTEVSTCFSRSSHCNGKRDCSDNSDEENCIPQSINNPTERSLPSHPEEKYLVDKNTNPDKQTTTESGQKSFFKVKIKPKKNKYFKGRKAVLICRDLGDAGLPVRWSRGDNDGPLPSHFDDRNGILIIPNIGLEDEGTYICSAEGISVKSKIEGSYDKVFLRVVEIKRRKKL